MQTVGYNPLLYRSKNIKNLHSSRDKLTKTYFQDYEYELEKY